MCIVYLSIYRYRVQELAVDSRQMIKPETANRREIHRQAADEDGTQSGQTARTDADESLTR